MSSLYTAWLRTYFPQWVMIIPNVLGSIIPYNRQPTGVYEQCSNGIPAATAMFFLYKWDFPTVSDY
jgi:hypothetical protein